MSVYPPRLRKAALIADTAHCGQVRKYTGAPYLIHALEVLSIVESVTMNEDMRIAALLHDTVEDTNVTLEFIQRHFNYHVASLVDDLTHKFTKESHPKLNRKERFGLELNRLSSIRADAQTIKYADLISNTHDIVAHDPEFAHKTYLPEKWQTLIVLDRGDSALRKMAIEQIEGLMH